MAEMLKKFEFGLKHRRYPWGEWLNGKPWRLTEGTDYVCSDANFSTAAYIAAKRKGGRAHIHRESPGTIVIQFVPGSNGQT